MAITERYVTATGTDTYANSTNPSTPMSLSTAFANAAAGDRINVKQGTYTRSADDTLTINGSTSAPIVFRGYKTTIGDATLGRSSGGALDTSNMPTIAYDATKQLYHTNHSIVFESLIITGAINGNLVTLNGGANMLSNCSVTNTSNGASAIAVSASAAANNAIIDCDVSVTTSPTAALVIGEFGSAIGCRVTAPSGEGIVVKKYGVVAHCTIYSCNLSGIRQYITSGSSWFIYNTIHDCGTDGIQLVGSTTVPHAIVGNHITNCGDGAIDFQTSTTQVHLQQNRYRDNVTNSMKGGSTDWATGTEIRSISDDTGGVEVDFTNEGSADFSLIAAAPAISKGPGYLIDIGANGTPVVTGGGGMKGWASA